MSHSRSALIAGCLACLAAISCSPAPRPTDAEATAGIDSLNARVVDAYRKHDAQAYGALYTDSAIFEWPAFTTVRGPAALASMARDNWGSLRDMDLVLTVSSRRLAGDHATEFGSFQQSWSDSAGARMTEFGRYVTVLARQKDGSWLMDRFFGFEDSTRASRRNNSTETSTTEAGGGSIRRGQQQLNCNRGRSGRQSHGSLRVRAMLRAPGFNSLDRTGEIVSPGVPEKHPRDAGARSGERYATRSDPCDCLSDPP